MSWPIPRSSKPNSGRRGSHRAESERMAIRHWPQPIGIVEADRPILVQRFDLQAMHVRRESRERFSREDHRLNPRRALSRNFEERILERVAHIDETHRRVESAVTTDCQIDEHRSRTASNDLDRDTAPRTHPGASRQRPMIAAFQYRPRRELRQVRLATALRESLEIVKHDARRHLLRIFAIIFEQCIKVGRAQTNQVARLRRTAVSETGASPCARIGEATSENVSFVLCGQETHFHWYLPCYWICDWWEGIEVGLEIGRDAKAGRGHSLTDVSEGSVSNALIQKVEGIALLLLNLQSSR